jgi:flagellar biosynthesis protein FliR
MSSLVPQLLILLAGCPRVFALVALAPGLNVPFIPPLVRVILAAALAFALSPVIAPANGVLDLTPQAFLALLLSELILGAILGFLLSCLLEAARLGGEIIDVQIGFQAGAMYDPMSASSSATIGRFLYMAALVFFFVLNGHHWLLAGLMRSFELCPVGTLVYTRELVPLAVQVVSALFLLALQIAAPVLAALILADLALGLVGRAMPSMNLMLVGMPGKIMVGVATLVCCSPMMATAFARMMGSFEGYLLAVLKAVSS